MTDRSHPPSAAHRPIAPALGILLAGVLAALVSACTINVGLAGRRVVDGDLAAASIGLAAQDPWLGEVGHARLRPAGVFAPDYPGARRRGPPLLAWRPAPALPITVTVAPALALAAGAEERSAEVEIASAAQDLAPALGPADLGAALDAPLPALRPTMVSAPPLPPPARPISAARRLWLPPLAPWQEPAPDGWTGRLG